MNNDLFITLMRHGRSLADDEQVHEGRYDSPLTDVGRKQYLQRANEWKIENKQFDLIISSTMQRARSSAQIVADALNVPIVHELDWMEMDNGSLAGMPFDLAAKQFPRPVFRSPYEAFCGNGESSWQIYCRAARAMEALIRRGPGVYLVIAHGMIINEALRTICGTGPSVNDQGGWFVLGDAAFVRLQYRPEKHQWRFLEFNPGFFPEDGE
jgi:2,3-bisphosphoglycerate-dependent phosphoglycerate mutase